MNKTARWSEKDLAALLARKIHVEITDLVTKKTKTLPGDRYKNPTEREYAERLECKKRAGLIVDWKYEPASYRLAKNTFIRPDFEVVLPDGLREIYEVKGFERERWGAKWKIFKEMYASFFAGFYVVKKINGSWKQA